MEVYTYIYITHEQAHANHPHRPAARVPRERSGPHRPFEGELVRRAVDGTYRPFERPKVSGFEVNVGLWKRPDAAVAGRRPPGRL
jgi:hypothetical protein